MKVIIEDTEDVGAEKADDLLLERINGTYFLSQLEEETGQEHVMLFTKEQAQKLQEALQLVLESA